MARRNHWGRPQPPIGIREAAAIALDTITRDEALGFLRLASRRLVPRPGGDLEVLFEVDIATELEPAVVAWVLVDRRSGEAVVEDLRPAHLAIAQATRRGSVAPLEDMLRRHPYVTAQAAAGIARQRSAAGEAAVRRLLDDREPVGLRRIVLRALGVYGPPSYELLIRGIASDDVVEDEATEALRNLESRRDAPEWLPAFSPCRSLRPFVAL